PPRRCRRPAARVGTSGRTRASEPEGAAGALPAGSRRTRGGRDAGAVRRKAARRGRHRLRRPPRACSDLLRGPLGLLFDLAVPLALGGLPAVLVEARAPVAGDGQLLQRDTALVAQ